VVIDLMLGRRRIGTRQQRFYGLSADFSVLCRLDGIVKFRRICSQFSLIVTVHLFFDLPCLAFPRRHVVRTVPCMGIFLGSF